MPYLSKPNERIMLCFDIVVGAWVSWGFDLALRDLLYHSRKHLEFRVNLNRSAKAEFMIPGGFGLKSACRGLTERAATCSTFSRRLSSENASTGNHSS